ncbi:MAG: TIGR03905 family TSCPD domain-containing protein [Anaerovoracaceae bacterium]|nr:TIGR03905 family TSCPD domain-containing protein [Bacillota bacterium]MDY2671017.1 TIGR03905 family TSCPD domain-containing protein [Anaerovoracaceae bacterium]
MHQVYNTSGTCSVQLEFDIDENGLIHNIKYLGGCDGNLKAIGLLAEGKKASEIADTLEGLRCGFKQTSCGDQLSKAIRQAGF